MIKLLRAVLSLAALFLPASESLASSVKCQSRTSGVMYCPKDSPWSTFCPWGDAAISVFGSYKACLLSLGNCAYRNDQGVARCVAKFKHASGMFNNAEIGTNSNVIVIGSDQHKITFSNNCPFDVWVGAMSIPGKQLPNKGGWLMKNGQDYDLWLPPLWAGRFWGRTQCGNVTTADDGKFQCNTGDCAHRFECRGASPVPPVTLAHLAFDIFNGVDSYDVSLVGGYNLPISIKPIDGTYLDGVGQCKWSGCNKDLNANCPEELRVYNADRFPVACNSACTAFDDERYCCIGQYACDPNDENSPCPGGSFKCDPASWPVNYPQIFKDACPAAFSFAYDDPLSATFTCKGNPYTEYEIIFCESPNSNS